MGRWGTWDWDTVESIGAVCGHSLSRADQHFIANAFDRHIKELHCSDFEVCSDPECSKAADLERGLTTLR
jgi:hypothetical protein